MVLLHQVARATEANVQPTDYSHNPLEGDRCWGGRVDLDNALLLASGLAQDDSGTPATFAAAHGRSSPMLRKEHKRWGRKAVPKISFKRAIGFHLCRFHMASREFVSSCDCFGGRPRCKPSQHCNDVLLVASIGFPRGGGRTKVVWALPQVQGLFYRCWGLMGWRGSRWSGRAPNWLASGAGQKSGKCPRTFSG